jgi:hypothetical protein
VDRPIGEFGLAPVLDIDHRLDIGGVNPGEAFIGPTHQIPPEAHPVARAGSPAL